MYLIYVNIYNNIRETNGNKVIASNRCGLHVHFDSKCLTSNPRTFKNFMRLYAEAEELIYKMCNDKNDPIRKGAINKDFRGIHLISVLWRNGMAAPSGEKILEKIEKDKLKVSYKPFGKFRMFASKYKVDERRYDGLNLTNIGNRKKNTIEFRMSNGTLSPEVIKQNVFFYASLMNTAIQMTENPQEYQERLNAFYRTDVSEEQKAKDFLNLIIDNSQDQQIYMDRWKTVKDSDVFARNSKKGFAQGRFLREQFKQIATRTPGYIVNEAFSFIKRMLSKTKARQEGEYSYGK